MSGDGARRHVGVPLADGSRGTRRSLSGVTGVSALGRRRRGSVPPTDDRLEELAGRRTPGGHGILDRFAAAGHPAMRGSLVAALLLVASFVRQRRRLRRTVGEEGI